MLRALSVESYKQSINVFHNDLFGSEIVETELKYGKDLRIIVDEFYHPMLGMRPSTNRLHTSKASFQRRSRQILR